MGEDQIAELRAAVEALAGRVDALEAFPQLLIDAFRAEPTFRAEGADPSITASAPAPAAFSSE